MAKAEKIAPHQVLDYVGWFAAHKAHLAEEKAFTRRREQLASERRALPWLKIEKDYDFDTTEGKKRLAELFAGRSQLIIYHFMFPPNADYRCEGCSFLVDHIDAANQHLPHHDVTLIVCARAPLPELLDYKARMGWQFDWVSSFGSDFNFDFQVSFSEEQTATGKVLFNFEERAMSAGDRAGVTVFFKDDDGQIYCTFQVRGRGGENLIGTYSYLDLTPSGRNETGPSHTLADWVRLHDEYGSANKLNERPSKDTGHCH
ncbi:DUF899 domain-containing protein [Mesorhizobium sp. Cs1299R1N3]|uniref:DUF899 domain-containing protein n=1 Tax=Mesorhizobium sp. Cs1299R1N3 TaxID=3015173 RepID=UPI00301D47B7